MFRAKLDSSGLFLGLEEVADLLDSDIELGEDCGLKPGKYRWDGTTFLPIPKSKQKSAPDCPSIEDVLHAIIKTMPNVPEVCAKWDAEYAKFIGTQGKVL